MSVLPTACVIGAGSSGIAAAKALHERGVPLQCFEKSNRSKRHTMQVDFDDYLYDLGKELRTGAARARAAGLRLPVAPLADAMVGS
jgi:cation diffusion facilitator CzcD-associated flavoprotein CzcO